LKLTILKYTLKTIIRIARIRKRYPAKNIGYIGTTAIHSYPLQPLNNELAAIKTKGNTIME